MSVKRLLNDEYRVIAASIAIGIGLWVIDAAIDAFIFFEGSFMDSFIFHVAGHELYFRIFFLLGFAAFGIVISRFIKRQKKAREELSRAIEAMQEEKAMSESILEAMGDAISIQNRDFTIIYQNMAHRRLMGDHAGKKCHSAYQGKEGVCDRCHLAMSFADGELHISQQVIETDDGRKYYEITASPLRNAEGEVVAGIEVVRDITARKRSEELIEISKKDWESTFDTIDDIITIHDRNFNIIRANRAVEKIFGMPVQQVINKKCYICFHGRSGPPDGCASCNSFRTGEVAVFEQYEPHLNKYLEIKAIPRFNGDGEIVGLIHIVRDITARKKIEEELMAHREKLAEMVEEKTRELSSAINILQEEISHRRHAEEALRISEKKYRTLYDNAPDMYHSLDENMIIIDCNETEARMLGYRKEEIIGKPLSDFMTEESKRLLEQDFPKLKEQKELKNLKRTFVRKDGSTFPVIINVFADFDSSGKLIMSRAIARDISDLRKVEMELRSANRTLRALSSFNSALIRIEEESDLLEETCRIIVETGGYRMAWVGYADHDRDKTVFPMAHAGDSYHYIESIRFSWDDSEAGQCPAGRAIRTGKTWIAHIPSSGDFAPWKEEALKRGLMSVISIPIVINDSVMGSLNIYSEVPDKFDSEEVSLLEQIAVNLSYGISVIRSTQEKKLAEAEVLRAGQLASLGELAAGVAHEINNPINGIINYAALISKKCPDGSTEREISERIIREGDRIANIVRSLLSFARDMKEGKKPTDLRQIISDTLALTEAQIRKDGIHLKLDIPDNLSPVIVQPQQIEQVFLNILSNSRYALNQKFDGEDEEKILSIRAKPVISNGSPFVRITFHDHGTGIPENIKDKIMNPFFSTKPGNAGTGLGLSISHGIISDHKGSINIESKEGSYTTVVVELPACC
jgi:PAS domain S-box-containing protein